MTNLVAFWPYDEYPYVLWDEVVKVNDDGKVTLKKYQGSVLPITVIESEKANEICKELMSLKNQYYTINKQNHIDFIRKAKDVFPKLAVQEINGSISKILPKKYEYGTKCIQNNIYCTLNGYVFYDGEIFALNKKFTHIFLISELQGESNVINGYSDVKIDCWTLSITDVDNFELEFYQASTLHVDKSITNQLLEQLKSVIKTIGFDNYKTTLNGISLYKAYQNILEYGCVEKQDISQLIIPVDDEWS